MNQKQWTKQALLQGRFITPLDALNECGCFRLGSRIFDLKAEGMDIKTRRAKGKNYAQYYLIAEGIRREF